MLSQSMCSLSCVLGYCKHYIANSSYVAYYIEVLYPCLTVKMSIDNKYENQPYCVL
jgi:hypothetical protein